MSDDTLKPCPFCGGPATTHENPYSDSVCCVNPDCQMFGEWIKRTNWQRRPIEDALRAELAAALDDLETARDNAATWKAETFQNFNRAKEAEAQLAAAQAREAKYREALVEIDHGPVGYWTEGNNAEKVVRALMAIARAALAEKQP